MPGVSATFGYFSGCSFDLGQIKLIYGLAFPKIMSETASSAGAPPCPITMCRVGERATISRISGREETKRFLAGLGFLAGGRVSVVSRSGDSFILDVKGSKIAIDGSMASRIVVNPERFFQ